MTVNIKARHLCDDIGDVQHQSASLLNMRFLKNSNCVKSKIGLYKSCRPQPDLQFVVQNFFSWGCFGTQIYNLNFEFQNSKFSNDLRWRKNIYESCSSPPDLQLCSWNFFQLRLFRHPNTWFKFWILNFQMTSDKKKYIRKL